VAIGGALLGTIFPQISATINLFDLRASADSGVGIGPAIANGSLILVGTVTTLGYFHFGARRRSGRLIQRAIWIEWISWVGHAFIAITLGTIFAGVYAAALTALVERWNFLMQFIFSFFLPTS
jgi:hypothetical protein